MNEREADADDKTEEATEERRRQFREEGNIANPREIMHALSLILLVIALYAFGGKLAGDLTGLFRRTWLTFNTHTLNVNELGNLVLVAITPMLTLLAGISLVLVVLPIATGLIFTQFNWTWKKLNFDLNNLNPVTGIQRVFSLKAIPELIKSIVKITLLGSTSYLVIRKSILNSNRNLTMDIQTISAQVGGDLLRLLMAIAVVSLVIGAGDWAWNWWQTERKMRMSKQDIKDEMKQQEGDPHVRAARRRMARDFIFVKAIQQVPKATFVVTNPEHYAVAIRYVKNMNAPIVVAKGMDFLALKIKEIAKENEIVLVENKALARTLYKTVKIGQEVPPSLYGAIIEVMKYISHTKGRDYFNRLTWQGDKA
jgi:flagellar biosynthetic protein FlhB